MKIKRTSENLLPESPPVFIGKPFQTQPRINLIADSPTYGLQTQSNFRLFCTYYRIFEYQRSQGRKRPVCFMSNVNLMSKHWANMSHVTFTKNKKKLLESGLIEVKTEDTWKSGKISFVWPTDAGWSKYLQIKAEKNKYWKKATEEKVEKKPKLQYTKEDEDNAKRWFKALRKFWAGYPGRLNIIGDWLEKREIRADAARKARKELGITAKEFQVILETILNSDRAQFFLENVIGPNTFNKKWKNGKSVARNMLEQCESIRKKQEEQEALILDKNDLPVYENEEGKYKEDPDVSDIWDSMWDIIGEHLRTKFSNKEERDKYRNNLIDLCEALADYMNYRPGRITLKNHKLREQLWGDEMPNQASYFYWLLDCYPTWKGFFSRQMLWQNWLSFWKKVWRLDHGSATQEDLQQFIINDIIQEGD